MLHNAVGGGNVTGFPENSVTKTLVDTETAYR